MQNLYLDANAHIPINTKALAAYNEFCNSAASHGHPSSPSLPGRLAATALEIARGKIASLIGAKKPGQIIFTSGCTQACEWGLEMFFQIEEFKGLSTACSPIEHSAVRDVFETLSEKFVGETTHLSVDRNGVIKTGEFDNIYQKISCIHMQNEIGIIQPLQKIKKKYLFADMSQSLGKIPVNVTELGIDIGVFGSHKFGGPGGFGFIYLKDSNHWESFGSGSRYFLDRAGTPDVAGAVATAVALEEAISTLEIRTKNMLAFQITLENGLKNLGFEIIGTDTLRSPNTTFIGGLNGKSINVMMDLSNEENIHTGLGSACGSMHNMVNNTMNLLSGDSIAWNYLRISQWGEYNEDDAKYLLQKMDRIWKRYAQ